MGLPEISLPPSLTPTKQIYLYHFPSYVYRWKACLHFNCYFGVGGLFSSSRGISFFFFLKDMVKNCITLLLVCIAGAWRFLFLFLLPAFLNALYFYTSTNLLSMLTQAVIRIKLVFAILFATVIPFPLPSKRFHVSTLPPQLEADFL